MKTKTYLTPKFEIVQQVENNWETELLKQEKEQLPSNEILSKLQKKNQLLESYLQDFTDEESFKEIKEKVDKIN